MSHVMSELPPSFSVKWEAQGSHLQVATMDRDNLFRLLAVSGFTASPLTLSVTSECLSALSSSGVPASTDENERTVLHLAVLHHSPALVNVLLTTMQPEGVLLLDRHGLSALHYAALLSNWMVLEPMLQGCPLQALYQTDSRGESVGHILVSLPPAQRQVQLRAFLAIVNRSVRVSQGSASRGTEDGSPIRQILRQCDIRGRPLLHACLDRRNSSLALILIDVMNDESLCAVDTAGMSPLHHAACSDACLVVTRMLLERLSLTSVLNTDGFGRTALHLATENMAWESLLLLVTYAPAAVGVADSQGRTCLHMAMKATAISHVPLSITAVLIQYLHPASLLSCDCHHETPLGYALEERPQEWRKSHLRILAGCIPFLLKDHSTDCHGRTVLHVLADGLCRTACYEDALAAAPPPLLLVRDHRGRSVLHAELMARRRDPRLAAIILGLLPGHCLAWQDESGSTVLHLAVRAGYADVAKDILFRMAPSGRVLQDKDGKTAAMLADSADVHSVFHSLAKRAT